MKRWLLAGIRNNLSNRKPPRRARVRKPAGWELSLARMADPARFGMPILACFDLHPVFHGLAEVQDHGAGKPQVNRRRALRRTCALVLPAGAVSSDGSDRSRVWSAQIDKRMGGELSLAPFSTAYTARARRATKPSSVMMPINKSIPPMDRLGTGTAGPWFRVLVIVQLPSRATPTQLVWFAV